MDIRDVAKRARVSTATVSRMLNRQPSVQAQLAKRVWKAVEELGYYPNRSARALVSGRSRVFGLVVSEITNPFFPEIVQTFENLAVDHGYEILLTSTIHDPKRMELAVRRMIEGRVDGIAVLTKRIGYITVVAGVTHASRHEAVYKHGPAHFIDLIFNRIALGRDFDDHVNIVWNIFARGD